MPDAGAEDAINKAFRAVLGRDIQPGESVSRAAVPGWDSLKHLELVFAVEAELGLCFNEDEIATVCSVDDLRALAASHRHAA